MRTSILFRTLASVFLVVALPAEAQRITTYAGGGVGEQSPALNALLIGPSHLAFDRFNNLHVTDRGGHRILKITPSGVISTVMGTGFPGYLVSYNAATQKVSSPSGIAFRPTPFNFDPAVDELVFADTGNHWIVAIDTVTATETVPYREMGGMQGYCCDNFNVFADFDTPQGLAVDAAGNIFIADTNNHIVRRSNWHNYFTAPTIDRIAGIPQQAGSTGDGAAALDAKLQHPLAVAIDAAGDLYIAESHRIRKVNMTTGVISTLAGGTTAGFSPDGTAANASLLLTAPTDLKFGPDGNLYFVEAGNYRVRRIVGGVVQTVAGTGATTDSGDGAAATSAGLAGPRGIAFDADGNLFVTMHDSGKIRRIAAGTGVITTYAGGAVLQPNGGSFAGEGGRPSGIAMNSPGGATPMADGSVYLADAFNHRVRLATSDSGITTTIAGNGTPGSTGDGGLATAATLNTPVSVAVDAAGNRYIADANNSRVRKIDISGIITTFAGGGASSPGDGGPATSALLFAPTWVVARGSDVFIADGPGNRIVKVTAGVLTTVAGTGTPGSTGDGGPATAATLDFPMSFVFDAADNLFITEGNRVRKVVPGGTISTVAGTGTAGFSGDGGPATAAQLDLPAGIAVDTVGALYIVDGNNHRIRKVLPNGTIKTMAGDGNPGFSGDGGDSPGARLNQPSFITRDASGRLYVADTDNHRVRRIAPRVPYAPTVGTLTPGAGSISVGFTPPADDGNAPIIEYIAECSGPNASGAVGASSPIVVTGLTTGATYTCIVFARNAVDWGELSAPSAPVTVGLPPTITSAVPPTTGAVGTAYSHTYVASGAPAPTFTVDTGALPPGVTLSSAGVVSGTPTSSGIYSGTVVAANGFPPNASQAFTITVAKGATSVSVVSNNNPSTVTQSITFTATLTGTPAPTGNVAFKVGVATIPGCAAVAIVASEATCATTTLPPGTHSITAEYAGSMAYDAATSPALSQGVKPNPPSINSPAASATVPVNPTISGGGTIGATITVLEGVTTVCITTVSANPWSCTTTLGAGSHTIEATQTIGGQASAVTASRTFTVQPPSHLLTIAKSGAGAGMVSSDVGGLNCGSVCSVSYTQGTAVALSAAPSAGSFFAGWSGACSGTAACVVTMDAVKSVTATFTLTDTVPGGFSFTGATNVALSALVTSPAVTITGINAAAAISVVGGSYSIGCNGTFTTTAGTITSGQTVCVRHTSSASHATVTTTTLTIGGVSVNFTSTTVALVTHVLTITKAGTGSGTVTGDIGGGPTIINCGSDCTEAVPTGSTVTLTATPASGSSVAGWSYCSGTALVCEVPVSAATTVTVTFLNNNPPRLANISTRGQVMTGADVMIAGFIIGGSTAKTVVVTVAGPSLANAGIPNPLANPTLTLVRSADGVIVATNDNWQTQANPTDSAALNASGFEPANPLEPAIIATLPPGGYTAIVQGTGTGTGIGLVGVYEVDHPEVPLINISTRGQVMNGNDVMIAGLIIQGDNTQQVVITVAGPSLVNAGIPNALANPILTIVRASDGAVIATNDNWQAQANSADVTAIQNAGFAPAHILEPAVILTLPPGAYTAIVQGAGGLTGVGLVGVYKVQ